MLPPARGGPGDDGSVSVQLTKTVGVLVDPECLGHDPGDGHPESPERLHVILDMLRSLAIQRLPIKVIFGRSASEEDILRVHTKAHLERIKATNKLTVRLDADTIASPQSYEAALRAAGGAIAAVDAVMKGEVVAAMAAVRPPGHHAEPDKAMGFCLFNNVAIAAQHARATYGLSRIAIVDFDVHHGNGTQAAFYRDPHVLFISTHQAMLYPGTGDAGDMGEGAGLGKTINIPLSAEHGDAEYDAIYGGLISRLLEQFMPELILVSAGYDIAETDPLGGMSVTYEGFARIVGHLCNSADVLCKGRIVAVLEGGYSAQGIEWGVTATLEAMSGMVRVDDPRGPLVRLPLGDAARHLHLYREHFDI